MKELRIIKFNNGTGAVLCSGCRKILREGFNLSSEEKDVLSPRRPSPKLKPVFCKNCQK